MRAPADLSGCCAGCRQSDRDTARAIARPWENWRDSGRANLRVRPAARGGPGTWPRNLGWNWDTRQISGPRENLRLLCCRVLSAALYDAIRRAGT
jgi:hypothetical protein